MRSQSRSNLTWLQVHKAIQLWAFHVFFVFEVEARTRDRQTDGRTDGRTRNVEYWTEIVFFLIILQFRSLSGVSIQRNARNVRNARKVTK